LSSSSLGTHDNDLFTKAPEGNIDDESDDCNIGDEQIKINMIIP
jgi:hypothetical protein